MGGGPRRQLGVFDGVCIIVGIIIGAGIYETAPTVAACAGSGAATLGIWLVGGLLALTGSLCYATLATAFAAQGGDYVYLTKAYGRGAGFLFGWSQLLAIRPGDIALMAFIFARYASQIFEFPYCGRIYAAGAILVLSALNVLGVRQGKWTQNILTLLKVVGLGAIFVAALWAPQQPAGNSTFQVSGAGLQLAFILVLFTYGGWNEIAYVAAEVTNPKRNILRTLLIGVVTVTVVYLLANLAFLRTLGYAGAAGSDAVAADTMGRVFPGVASRLIAGLICVSALGAINGLIFTGARISYALGQDHRLFGLLGQWKSYAAGPVRALVIQGGLSLVIALVAGSFMDTILYTAPAVWLFFFGTGLSVFVLRHKNPLAFPAAGLFRGRVVPIIFCGTCLFMLINCVHYAFTNKPAALGLLAGLLTVGGVVYILSVKAHPSGKSEAM